MPPKHSIGQIGLGAYERQYEEHFLKNLKKQAAKLEFSLVPTLQNQLPNPQVFLLSDMPTSSYLKLLKILHFL